MREIERIKKQHVNQSVQRMLKSRQSERSRSPYRA